MPCVGLGKRRGEFIMMKACDRCGSEFYVRPSSAERRRFCSRECQFPNAGSEYVPPKGKPSIRRDLTGQTFNGIKLEGPSGRRDSKGQFKYICICHCGCEFENVGIRIASGHVKSCGCLRGVGFAKVTHGHTINRDIPVEYNTWSAMIDRCENHSNMRFGRYGGRGIYVCAGWRHSFDRFLEDMGRRPGPKMSIDRIDNDGPYACGKCEQCERRGQPANCRWASHSQQCSNQSRNRLIEYNGRTMVLAHWADALGIKRHTLTVRLKLGWSVEDAFTKPIRVQSPAQPRVPVSEQERRARQAAGQRRAMVANGGHKLQASDVAAIKRRLASGEKHNRLAREFGVSNTMIGYIASGKQWSQVEV